MPGDLVRLQVDLTQAEAAELKQITSEEHISRSNLIRRLIKFVVLLRRFQRQKLTFYAEHEDGTREIVHFL